MMILPILTYRSIVKLHFNNTQQRKLKSLEDRAKNIIGREVPCIINSIKRETCGIVRRSLDKKMCSNFNEYFTINEHTRNTRNAGYLLKVPKVKLELGKQSFAYAGTILYNELPLESRKIDSYSKFNIEVKNILTNFCIAICF